MVKADRERITWISLAKAEQLVADKYGSQKLAGVDLVQWLRKRPIRWRGVLRGKKLETDPGEGSREFWGSGQFVEVRVCLPESRARRITGGRQIPIVVRPGERVARPPLSSDYEYIRIEVVQEDVIAALPVPLRSELMAAAEAEAMTTTAEEAAAAAEVVAVVTEAANVEAEAEVEVEAVLPFVGDAAVAILPEDGANTHAAPSSAAANEAAAPKKRRRRRGSFDREQAEKLLKEIYRNIPPSELFKTVTSGEAERQILTTIGSEELPFSVSTLQRAMGFKK